MVQRRVSKKWHLGACAHLFQGNKGVKRWGEPSGVTACVLTFSGSRRSTLHMNVASRSRRAFFVKLHIQLEKWKKRSGSISVKAYKFIHKCKCG
jgi:hypothetical protein